MRCAVVGLDLSLRATGMVAIPRSWSEDHDWSSVKFDTVGAGLPRHATVAEHVEHIDDIVARVAGFVYDHDPEAVFIEHYAFGAFGAGPNLGELGGVVKDRLVRVMGRDVRLVVASSARKLAFGKVPRGIKIKEFIEKRMALVGAPFPTGKAGEDTRDAFVIANFGLTELGLPAMTIPAPDDETLEPKKTKRNR